MAESVQVRKVVYYVCSYCKTRKGSNDPSEQCKNCGAIPTIKAIRMIDLGRQPFGTDNREARPQ